MTRRYTVTATTATGELVWSADFSDKLLAVDLFNSAVGDPTEPVRRVVLTRDDTILLDEETE